MSTVSYLAPSPLTGGGLNQTTTAGKLLCKVVMNGNATDQGAMVIGAFEKILGNTTPYHRSGFTTGANNRMTATTATGVFSVRGYATVTGMTASDTFSIGLFSSKSGTVADVHGISTSSGTGPDGDLAICIPIQGLVLLRSGDYVEAHIRNNVSVATCLVTELLLELYSTGVDAL
jgi:hypothetical protein